MIDVGDCGWCWRATEREQLEQKRRGGERKGAKRSWRERACVFRDIVKRDKLNIIFIHKRCVETEMTFGQKQVKFKR